MAVALTTTFTPPVSCTTDVYFITTSTDYYFQLGNPSSTSACFPSGWNSDPAFVYSPGICPQGYTTGGCDQSIREGTTTAICCPIGFQCSTVSPYWFAGELCSRSMGSKGVTIVTTIAGGLTGTTSLTFDVGDGINAYGMSIEYASSDFPAAATTTTASSTSSSTQSSTTTAATTSSTPTSSSETSTPTPSPDNGLSTGAKAGIGVGAAAAGIIAIAALVVFLLRRKRPSSQRPSSQSPPQEMYGSPVAYGSPQTAYKDHNLYPHTSHYAPMAPHSPGAGAEMQQQQQQQYPYQAYPQPHSQPTHELPAQN